MFRLQTQKRVFCNSFINFFDIWPYIHGVIGLLNGISLHCGRANFQIACSNSSIKTYMALLGYFGMNNINILYKQALKVKIGCLKYLSQKSDFTGTNE